MALLKVIATDDEPGILLLISDILREIQEVELVGTAQNAEDTIKLTQQNKPDIAFLDIQLPDMQGFDLAKILRERIPDLSLVFITAHKDFSLNAFEIYAIDYILKPIDPQRIQSTLSRIQMTKRQMLKGNVIISDTLRISLSMGNEKVYVKPSEIIFIERVGRKSCIHCIHSKIEVGDTLQELEQRLGAGFFRSHKSYIINLQYVLKIVNCSNSSFYEICFRNFDTTAFLSRNRVHQIMDMMEA